ncbi:hypothetical protein FA95DRAFT_1607608 [Auriscalpium vulgare]|uniref:Uncharacterized protein n=1 Tax=Auriscalpium vulgare TaxID=40419 RepID=A0ACB8RPK7_9AGAM|nr:hypothetical protein FA95DRAFT_1607608 [Auriscalpium vulgare]
MSLPFTPRSIIHAPTSFAHALLRSRRLKSVQPPIIPYDIQIQIIGWVYRYFQHGLVDFRTLRACSLVCKAWTGPSQRFLFRKTPTMFNPPFDRLLSVMRANPLLKTYVRKVSLSIYSDPELFTAKIPDFLSLLAVCPHVTVLHIFIDDDCDLSLLHGVVDGLRALNLRLPCLHVQGVLEAMAPFIRLWPDLQSLQFLYPDDAKFDPAVPPVPLKSLRRLRMPFHDDKMPYADCMLRGADFSGLRELHLLYSHAGRPHCLHALASLLASITILKVTGAPPPQHVLDRCAQLQTLIFSEWLDEALTLPRTLQHCMRCVRCKHCAW